jgi:tetratricopeptide (TPR) repeat protein
MTAVNSHAILPIARDCGRLEADVWVIYMGNNEVLGPFGLSTLFGVEVQSLTAIRTSLAARTTRIGQLLERGLTRLGASSNGPTTWQGMEMFLDQQVRHDDPRLEAVYSHYERNLRDLLDVAKRRDVRVVISTMVSNLKDCAPFASLHSLDLSDGDKESFAAHVRTGGELEASGNPAGAIEAFLKALEIDDDYAELHFRLGRCYEALEKHDDALRHFVLARELDSIRLRPVARINEIIRSVSTARAGDEVLLADSERVFMERSPHGITGEEHLHEHVHFNFEGN